MDDSKDRNRTNAKAMKRRKKMPSRIITLASAALVLLAGAASAGADEITQLKRRIAEQQRLLEQMAARLDRIEAEQAHQQAAIDQKVASTIEEKRFEALPEGARWLEKVKLSGDLRYRHESIDSESGGDWTTGRHRNRIRARLGVDAKINDNWDTHFRIASGSGDPVSTNQSLDNSFSSKELWLDLAYFDWHPARFKDLNFYGGKMKNPFFRVGKNQLIWDSDLNPEGIAAGYKKPLGNATDLFINGGGFWVDESSGGVDTSLWGAQAYLKRRLDKGRHILAGAGYYDYGNIEGRGDLASTWGSSSDFFGNTVASDNTFANDYDVLEGFAEYGFELASLPAAFFGNYARNTAATSTEDTGWLIGCSLNKAKAVGSWQASYMYREVEADAVLGAFTDSDFVGGGTDGKGHMFGFKYQLAENLQGALTYFMSERGSTESDYNRLQADLILKF
jgi:hypothetical protein